MEPVTLTTVATAIATIFFTKVIEKPGENLGQLLWDKTQNLVARLQGQSDKIAGLLEGNQQQPLDYGEAVLELKALADRNPELAQAIKEVEAKANKESNPKFKQQIQEVREEADKLKNLQPTIQNLSKLAEKIGVVNQGVMNNTTINI
jgi:hypothetical protein